MSDQKNWYDDNESEPVRDNSNTDDYVKKGSYNYNNGYNQYNDSYNNPYGNRPVNPSGTNARFGGAAFGCGIASIATLFTGVFSLMLGALGLIFANLSRRRGVGYPARAKAGMVMSIIGMVIGAIITLNSFIYVYTVMGSEEFYNEFNSTYQMIYGEELDMEEYEQMFNWFGKN